MILVLPLLLAPFPQVSDAWDSGLRATGLRATGPQATGSQATGPQGQALWHPAGANLALLAPDVAGWLRAVAESPLAQVIEDPRLSSALEEFGGAGFDPAAVADDPSILVEPLFDAANLPDELRTLLRGAAAELDSVSLSLAGVDATNDLPKDILSRLRQVEEDFADVERVLDEHSWSGEGTYPAELAAVGLDAGAFVDPWGRPYRYERIDGGRGYVVSSVGADGEEGGRLLGADLHLRMDPGGFWAQGDVGETKAALLTSALHLQAVLSFRTDARAAEVFGVLTDSASLQLDPAVDPTHAQVRSLDVAGRALPARVLGLPQSPLPYLIAVRQGNALSLTLGAEPDAEMAGLRGRLEGSELSLSGVSGYLQGARHAGAPHAADTVFVTYRSMPLLQLVAQGAELASRLSGEDEGLDELLAVLELVTGAEPRGTYTRYTFRDGLYHVASLEQMPDEPVGLARFLGRAPVALDPAVPIPPDSMLVYTTSLDGAELRDALLGLIADQGGASAQEWRAALEKEYDCAVEDLIGQLGGSLLVVSDRVRGLAVPQAYGFVDVADSEAFWTSFEGFSRFLADTFPEEIQLGTRPYKKVPLVTFKLESLGGFVQPSFCVLDGQLIASVTGPNLKKEIKRRLGGVRPAGRRDGDDGDGEGDAGKIHALLGSDYPIAEGARSIYYMDWGAALGGLYSTVRTFASIAGGMEEFPFDLEALPPPEIFTENLRPGFHTTRQVDGGILLEGRSSFGPEVSFGLVTGLGLGLVSSGGAVGPAAGVTGEAVPDVAWEVEVRGAGPGGDEAQAHTQTRVGLGALRTALAIYKIEYGSYPDALDALVQSSEAYPAGLIEGGVLPLDGWGHAFRYTDSADGKSYTLWSVGPDGLDDGGAGDDVSSQ